MISWGRQSAQLWRTLMIFWWCEGFSAKQISSCRRNLRLFSKACCSSNYHSGKKARASRVQRAWAGGLYAQETRASGWGAGWTALWFTTARLCEGPWRPCTLGCKGDQPKTPKTRRKDSRDVRISSCCLMAVTSHAPARHRLQWSHLCSSSHGETARAGGGHHPRAT